MRNHSNRCSLSSFPRARWAALMALTVAACGPGAEPTGVNSTIIPETAFSQTQAYARCRGALTWRGMTLAPAGRASLGVGDDANPVQVSNIGRSGRDGFCVSHSAGVSGVTVVVKDGDTEGSDFLLWRTNFLDDAGRAFGQEVSFDRTPRAGYQMVHRLTGGPFPMPVRTVALVLAGVVQATGVLVPNAQGEIVLGVVSPRDAASGLPAVLQYTWDLDANGVVSEMTLLDSPRRFGTSLAGAPTVMADEIQVTRSFPSPISLRSAIWTFVGTTNTGQFINLEIAEGRIGS